MENQELKIKELETEQKGLVVKSQEIQIISQETLQVAVSFTQEIKKLKKKVEDEKKFYTAPLEKQKKSIIAKFKPLLDLLTQAEKDLKDDISIYQLKENERIRKEEERIRKAQEKKYEKKVEKAEEKGDIPPPPPQPISIKKPKVEGLQLRDNWKARITDKTLIRRELLIPDLVTINKLAKTLKENFNEPGIEAYNEPVPAIGSKEEEL